MSRTWVHFVGRLLGSGLARLGFVAGSLDLRRPVARGGGFSPLGAAGTFAIFGSPPHPEGNVMQTASKANGARIMSKGEDHFSRLS